MRFGVSSPPVPVEEILRRQGATLVYHDFENEISGLIVRKAGVTVVAVAKEQARTRQRFTIAHEIGHLVMHEPTEIHVDKNFSVLLRSTRSSEAVDVLEMEANAFAAALLMPERLLRPEIKHLSLDIENDPRITELAREYEVSAQAMTYRLTNLMSRGRT